MIRLCETIDHDTHRLLSQVPASEREIVRLSYLRLGHLYGFRELPGGRRRWAPNHNLGFSECARWMKRHAETFGSTIPTSGDVRPEDVEATIKSLHYKFRNFHLSPCYRCGAPSWGQPCWQCGFYPMGDRGYARAENNRARFTIDRDTFIRRVSGRGGILFCYLISFDSRLDPQQHILDAAAYIAAGLRWPRPGAVWDFVHARAATEKER